MKIKNADLAGLIKQGAAMPGVVIVEGPMAIGVIRRENGTIVADIVGLALIGKMGLESAIKLFYQVPQESASKYVEPNFKINNQLRISFALRKALIVRAQCVGVLGVIIELEQEKFEFEVDD